MDVRCVDTARFEEPDSSTDAEIGENRESLNVLKRALIRAT